MVTLIGMGSGTPELLTAQGLAALQSADLIIGANGCWNICPPAAPRTGKLSINRRIFCPAFPSFRQ